MPNEDRAKRKLTLFSGMSVDMDLGFIRDESTRLKGMRESTSPSDYWAE